MPLALAAGLALSAFYIFTAYPGLSPYRDAGDMASAAMTLGIAHPPGYPLYALAGRLWLALVPAGDPAYRLHALSALCAAAACLLAARAAKRLSGGEGRGAAATAFLLLGLAPAFRHLAVVSEMYALSAVIAAALLCAALSARPRAPLAAALLAGVGMGSHQTLLFALPGLAWARRRGLAGRGGAWAAGFFLLGLAVYLYLPLRAAAGPIVDWGDPRTPAGLWRLLTRADYGGLRLHPDRPAGLSPSSWAASALYAARLFSAQLGAGGLALALWGAWVRRREDAARGAAAAFLLSGPVFVLWANLDPARPESAAILEPHLVLPLVFAAALAGVGAADLLARGRPAARAALAAAALLWPWPSSGTPLSWRADHSALDYGRGLLAGLPPGALVLDPDDPTAFTLGYLALRGERPDVVPILYFRTRWGYERLKRLHPEVLPPWEAGSGQELVGAIVSRGLAAGRPLYLDLPQKTPEGRWAVPEGLAYRLLEGPASAAERRERLARAESAARRARMRRPPARAGFFTRHAAAYWASALNNVAIEAQSLGMTEEAVRFYRLSLAYLPLPEAFNNLGNALLARGDAAGAEGCYLASLRLRESAQAAYNLGRVKLVSGRLEEAEASFLRALRTAYLPDAANDLGLAYLRAGRVERALAQWQDVLSRAPGYAPAYYNLGLGYEKLGDRRKAWESVFVYRELAREPADKEEATRWMARLKNW